MKLVHVLSATASFMALAMPAQAQNADDGTDEGIVVVGKGYGIEVGTKSLAPLREVPNTVTLVDRERIQQQNLFTITDLASQTIGLTTTGGDSDLAQFMSRGFTIDNYLVDGVPNNGFTGEIPDLFLYDRVEILRGPAGLFSGSGSPAASIWYANDRCRYCRFKRWQRRDRGIIIAANSSWPPLPQFRYPHS